MASSIYTIFGRYFGLAEKFEMTTRRMRDTTESFSRAIRSGSEDHADAIKNLEIHQKAYNKLSQQINNAQIQLSIFQSLKAAGEHLSTRELRHYEKVAKSLYKNMGAAEEAKKKIDAYQKSLEAVRDDADIPDYLRGIETAFKMNDKALEGAGRTATNYQHIQDKLIARGQFFSDIVGTKLPLSIAKVSSKIVGLGRSLKILEEIGGPLTFIKMQITEIISILKLLNETFKTLYALIIPFLVSPKTYIALAAIATVVGTIYMGFKALQTIWRENIGGIQSTFIQVVGQFKNTMAEIGAFFRATMRELGPTIEPFISMIGDILSTLIKGIGPAIKLLITLLMPVFKIVGSIFGFIGRIYETFKLMNGEVGNIGRSMRYVVAPIFLWIDTIKMVWDSFKRVWDILNQISEGNGPLSRMARFILGIVDAVKFVIKGFLDMINVIKAIEDLFDRWDALLGKNKEKTKQSFDGISPDFVRAQIGGGGDSNVYTNNPTITVYTNDPTDSQQAANVWGDVSKEYIQATRKMSDKNGLY